MDLIDLIIATYMIVNGFCHCTYSRACPYIDIYTQDIYIYIHFFMIVLSSPRIWYIAAMRVSFEYASMDT